MLAGLGGWALLAPTRVRIEVQEWRRSRIVTGTVVGVSRSEARIEVEGWVYEFPLNSGRAAHGDRVLIIDVDDLRRLRQPTR